MSSTGSCALSTLVLDNKLYVANIGDCMGVLLTEESDGSMKATELNTLKCANSKAEQERLNREFPDDPKIWVMKRGNPKSCYVKGRLQPTTAFGDLHLKHEEFNNPKNLKKLHGR